MAVLDSITGPKVKAYSQAGPSSYAAGGFLFDASADFSWLGFVDVAIDNAGMDVADFEVLLNKDLAGAEALGKAAVKVLRPQYDRISVGAVTSLPTGVATQSALFAAGTTSGSAHSHTANHDHPSVVSDPAGSSGLPTNTALTVNLADHTHTVDLANFTGSTTGTTHAHDRAFEYEHSHTIGTTLTEPTLSEPTGTDLSGVTFRLAAYGFGEQ